MCLVYRNALLLPFILVALVTLAVYLLLLLRSRRTLLAVRWLKICRRVPSFSPNELK